MWHQAAQGTQAVWCKKQKTKHKCRNEKIDTKKIAQKSYSKVPDRHSNSMVQNTEKECTHYMNTYIYESATVEKGKKWIQNFDDYKMILQICQSRNTPPKTKCRNCLTGDWWSGEGVGDTSRHGTRTNWSNTRTGGARDRDIAKVVGKSNVVLFSSPARFQENSLLHPFLWRSKLTFRLVGGKRCQHVSRNWANDFFCKVLSKLS